MVWHYATMDSTITGHLGVCILWEFGVLSCALHLRSPRFLCVRSLGSPRYDNVYFNSTSSSIQWLVSLLQWLTKLSGLNVSHYATMNNKTSVKLKWRCFKNWYMIGRIESVRVQSDKVLKIQKINAMCGRASLWKLWGPAKGRCVLYCVTLQIGSH